MVIKFQCNPSWIFLLTATMDTVGVFYTRLFGQTNKWPNLHRSKFTGVDYTDISLKVSGVNCVFYDFFFFF